MNGCRKIEDLLMRHLHGETLACEREEIDRHMAGCSACLRLYRSVSAIDRALRDAPGKLVEPPPHLHAKILANLPEGPPPLWERWGRWAVGFGAAAAALVALLLGIQRPPSPPAARTASAPAPEPAAQAPPAGAKPGASRTALPAAKTARPAAPPALSAAPGGGRRRTAEVAAVPKVEVIREVKIFFYHPPARTVAVTGDFNDWNVEGVPLHATGKPGLWETDLRLPPGVYSYNFIVDGELLVPDPNSPNQMPDGYGGTNSLLLVKGEGAI